MSEIDLGGVGPDGPFDADSETNPRATRSLWWRLLGRPRFVIGLLLTAAVVVLAVAIIIVKAA